MKRLKDHIKSLFINKQVKIVTHPSNNITQNLKIIEGKVTKIIITYDPFEGDFFEFHILTKKGLVKLDMDVETKIKIKKSSTIKTLKEVRCKHCGALLFTGVEHKCNKSVNYSGLIWTL